MRQREPTDHRTLHDLRRIGGSGGGDPSCGFGEEMRAASLGAGTHEGSLCSILGRMRGTFTPTYGVKVPFMR
jgi:hypothetical protein